MKIDSNIPSSYVNMNVQNSNTGTDDSSSAEPIKTTKSQPPAQAVESYKEIAQKPKSELSMGEKNWVDVIEKANKAIVGATCTFEFSIHDRTKEIMVKVIDKDTKKVIREIPPEKVLDMVAKMWEMAGLIVDERR